MDLPGLPFWTVTLRAAPFPSPFEGLLDRSLLLTLGGPGLGGQAVRSCSAVWEPARCGGRGGWLRLARPPALASGLRSRDPLMVPVGRASRSLAPVLALLAPSLGLSRSGRVVAACLRAVPEDLPGTVLALTVMEA